MHTLSRARPRRATRETAKAAVQESAEELVEAAALPPKTPSGAVSEISLDPSEKTAAGDCFFSENCRFLRNFRRPLTNPFRICNLIPSVLATDLRNETGPACEPHAAGLFSLKPVVK